MSTLQWPVILLATTNDQFGQFNLACLSLNREVTAKMLFYRTIIQQIFRQEPGVYAFEVWDTWCDYGASSTNDIEDEFEEGTWYQISGDPGLGQPFRSATHLCRITKTGVLFTAYPKHGDREFETPELPWEAIEQFAEGGRPLGYIDLDELARLDVGDEPEDGGEQLV